MKQMIEPCWTRENSSQKVKKTPKKKDHRDRTDRTPDDETSALLIGSITELPVDAQADPSDDEAEHSVAEQQSQIPATEFVEEVAEPDSEIQCPIPAAEFVGEEIESSADSQECVVPPLACDSPGPARPGCSASPVTLDHHIFDTKNGWKKSESMAHPTLRLCISTDSEDYDRMGIITPDITPSYETAVTDTGAMSCLWGLLNFYRAGFKDSDLIPVKRTMVAANKERINISGAILLRVSGKDNLGDTYTAVVMVYVSPDTTEFYLLVRL